jgi:hypothetical protein
MPRTMGALRAIAVVGLLGIAVTHAAEASDKFEEVPYQGYLFIALIVACVALAALSRVMSPTLWWTGALTVSVVPFVLFIVSRTAGLPSGEDDIGAWSEPMGIASLVFEAVTAIVAMRALQALAAASRVMAPSARRRTAGPSHRREPISGF